MNPRIILKQGKEKNLLARHPWIFSGAIARADNAHDGDTVDVCDASGKWLARGYYNARSQIAVRVWTWNDEPIDRAFFHARLTRAIAARESLVDRATTDAYRLVNAESDLLPGMIVDRYADFVVVQFLTLGADRRREDIVAVLDELLHPRGIYERSDVDVREKEGLASVVGVLHGDEPPDRVEIRENSFRLLVDVKRGHKTGLYLDQRENRKRVAELFTAGEQGSKDTGEILNVFSYTGGFSVYACAANANARAVNLDASREALDLARENMRLNDCAARGEFVEGDAFVVLRKYRDMAKSFDAIILDPPKFVHAQSQMQSGLRGYKDINLLAFKLLKPGGTLVTFSCSGQVSAQMFQTVVFEAATDAHRDVQIIGKLSQSPDHPILLAFPESEYLKGLVCRVL
ncbi:MAG: class I SAM-dependent methyltransferase [Chloroflexi bacterium]|nr:class I SAM-dependent methyltransferase [Chloroflexota bacterium]